MAQAPAGYRFSFRQPDDWHLHHRDGEMMVAVVPFTARVFRRSTSMPNLLPPVTTVAMAEDYARRLKEAAPQGSDFEPHIPLYLTDQTTEADVIAAKNSSVVHGLKYYPPAATTNSASGITTMASLFRLCEWAEKHDLPMLFHGEVVDADVDVFDREAVFVDTHFAKMAETFPRLRMVLEHVSSKTGADFVRTARAGVVGTLTPHHLRYTRTDMLGAGMSPHLYCAPIIKTARDRAALVRAALSDSGKFFAGTDSAPHLRRNKESARGHFGIFSAPHAVGFYAEIFDAARGLHKKSVQRAFENFMSVQGAEFYRLPLNTKTVTLEKTAEKIPASYPCLDDALVPMGAGGEVAWKIVSVT